jgi:CRISPR-associated endoribonuclease Cas6
MRIIVYITGTIDSLIPYNYQPMLTGTIHKWIGSDNEEHGKQSLFSFSFFQNVLGVKAKGLALKQNSCFFFSSYDIKLFKKLLSGIKKDPKLFNGIMVKEVQLMQTPEFSVCERFLTASPILLKLKRDDGQKHILFSDTESSDLLTISIKSKLEKANLSTDGISVEFDNSYPNPKTKLMNYNKINNKASVCPVIIKGTPEQIAFAWEVGLGNSTGIGFGALK